MKLNLGRFIGKGVAWLVARVDGTAAGHKAGDAAEAVINPVIQRLLDEARPKMLQVIEAEVNRAHILETSALTIVRDRFVLGIKRLNLPPEIADRAIIRLDNVILPQADAYADGGIDELARRARAIVESL